MLSTPMRITVIILLSIAALGEVFGTITVWINYHRSANVGRRLYRTVTARDMRNAEAVALAAATGDTPPLPEQGQMGFLSDVGLLLHELQRDVGETLRPRWYLRAGLFAYVVGALAGLAAGLIAVVG